MFGKICMFSKKSYLFKRRWPLLGIVCLLLLVIISGILFVPNIKGSGNPSSRPSSHRFGQTATAGMVVPTLTATVITHTYTSFF